MQGVFEDAREEADRGYHASQGKDLSWAWRFRILEAEAYLRQGKPEQALELLNEEPPKGSPLDISARKKILQAEVLCRLNQRDAAELMFQDADRLIPSSEKDLRSQAELAQGRCAALFNATLAQIHFTNAASLAHGENGFVEGIALMNLGFLLLQEEHYQQAVINLKQVSNVTDSAYAREKALGNLGFIYSQLGDWKNATFFSQQAETLASQIKNEWDQKKWLIDLGREQFSQMEYTKAQSSFSEAQSIAHDLNDLNDGATCLHNLAQLALRTNDLSKADGYTHQLENMSPKGGHYFDLMLDRVELAKAREDFPAADRGLNDLLGQLGKQRNVEPATLWTAQSDLAVVYSSEGKFDLAENMFRRAIATADNARKKIEGVEYQISFLDQAPFYDRYVKFLVSRNKNLGALGVAELGRSPTLSEGLDRGKRTSLQDAGLFRIQADLRAHHSIALAYWLGWEESYLWAITPTQIKLFHLPAEPEIEREAEAYTRAILDRDETAESQRGTKLYDTLVRPAAALIPPGTNVVIVPHRKLYNLNFETLVAPDPKPHYWIEDVRLQNASFLGALAGHSTKALADPKKKMLLIGAPVLADKQFPQLKFANEEIKKVSMHFPSGEETVLTGNQATPQAYLDGDPGQYDLLHFVTHGTSSTVAESPLDAAIILSPVSGNPSASADPEGSYRLYGKEIMKAPLHADLVTVSACYGLGREYSGEGLVGLAWAFLRAGAHQVIAALWEVDDASSPQLMDDFYGELTQGKSAAEALRDAKLKMLHSSDFHRHPYYWASLQLYTGS